MLIRTTRWYCWWYKPTKVPALDLFVEIYGKKIALVAQAGGG